MIIISYHGEHYNDDAGKDDDDNDGVDDYDDDDEGDIYHDIFRRAGGLNIFPQ